MCTVKAVLTTVMTLGLVNCALEEWLPAAVYRIQPLPTNVCGMMACYLAADITAKYLT